MAVLHPGNPDEQRERDIERERERDEHNEAGVVTASLWLDAWLFAWPFACVFVCLPSYPIRCRRACLLPCLTMPSETGGEREREIIWLVAQMVG